MNWYRDLYVGKTFCRKKKRIKRLVEAGEQVPMLFLILLRRDQETNQLEIIPQLAYRANASDSDLVVGLASGMREAQEIMLELTDTVYRRTGTADLKRFILCRQDGEKV